MALRNELGEVRPPRARHAEPESPSGELGRADLEPLLEQFRKDSVDAAHFMGLAAVYADHGEHSAAVECLEMCKEKAPTLPYAYKLHGKLLLRKRDLDGAARELHRAQKYNPFDREVAEWLGRVEYERRNFAQAIESAVDAILLLTEDEPEAASRLRRKVRALRSLLGWDQHALRQLFRERRQRLTTSFDRLRWRRDRFLEERGLLEASGPFRNRPFHRGGARLALATRLRQIPQWSSLSDEAVFQLTLTADEEFCSQGDLLFSRRSKSRDLLFIESGDVRIERPTPYGKVPLDQRGARELVGVVHHIDGLGHTGEVLAAKPTQLIRLDADVLEELVEGNPRLGVQVYGGLWHALASRLRQTNDRLRGFQVDSQTEQSDMTTTAALAGTPVKVPTDDKIRLFKEQGLSRTEVLSLAAFARERHYPEDRYIFREGDVGTEMFLLLDGRVRISQFSPAAGEEALAILGRGEFFGELALIDGQPRSADARTHDGPATVVVIDRALMQEALSMEPEAALEFQRLLCRVLASRLREIAEKISLWQILARQDHQTLNSA